MTIVSYVGIDAHEDTLVICSLPADPSGKIFRTTIANDPISVQKTFEKLSKHQELRCCYEASSGGYILQRQLTGMGIHCDVIAPSLIPQRAGDKIKTDRRDAFRLAQLYQKDELTAVHSPTLTEESARRVSRLREQFVRDVVESKNHLNRFLGGMGRRYSGKSRWTLAHWKWLKAQSFDLHDQFVFDELVAALNYKISRLDAADLYIVKLADSPAYKEQVARLCCLKGVGIVTAMTLITEIIDFSRFGTATSLMCYLGMVPSEYSSGSTRRQGCITKAGNSHCRRVLVEAAWKYAFKPSLCKALKDRQAGQPAPIVAHAMKAQHRLNQKFKSVAARHPRPVAAVATARELIGFVWSIMNDTPVAAA